MSVFEISWEVCNKIGGIYTVLQSKAESCVERFGDDYWTVGPLIADEHAELLDFEDEDINPAWHESCRAKGLTIRVGRWQVPGQPRCILVGFSGLFTQRDGVLARLWEQFRVDSLFGGWDYIEPVLFSYAAGQVIETLWNEHLQRPQLRPIIHVHEWMTGAALLYLKARLPEFGAVFTTHATILGRSLSAQGEDPLAPEVTGDPAAAAARLGIRAKHSMESTVAQQADVFSTVSEHTANEAERFLGRRPDLTTPNGINFRVFAPTLEESRVLHARERLRTIAEACFGALPEELRFIAISGRYEFENKGIDRFLAAIRELNDDPGATFPCMVAFLLIPAANTGLDPRLPAALAPSDSASPSFSEIHCTHRLSSPHNDAITRRILELHFPTSRDAKIKVLHVPAYVSARDSLFACEYEELIAGFDLTCFPSRYEPWGYTPAESLAAGVPTITTKDAGIGQWANSQGMGETDGIEVLESTRTHCEAEILTQLVRGIKSALLEPSASRRATSRKSAQKLDWNKLYGHYEAAYALAREASSRRAQRPTRTRSTLRLPRSETEFIGAIRPKVHRLDVVPYLPPQLRALDRLARNYWWTWHDEAETLFRRIDPGMWSHVSRDPQRLLSQVDPARLEALAQDASYLSYLNQVFQGFEHECGEGYGPHQVRKERPTLDAHVYISAEYALHEGLRIYSGGLGVLAGDHLKSASDLGLPLVALGLLYRNGYFQQSIDPNGNQLALPAPNDPRQLPLTPVLDADGRPLEIKISLPDRALHIHAYRVDVGRVPLYLLDTSSENNRPDDRNITEHLYVADRSRRMLQEIVLGIGGSRLLQALGIQPDVIHLNEGHSAFFLLEYATKMVREHRLSYEEVRLLLRSTTVFTTHTPVDAGHERFSEDIMRPYFSRVAERLGLSWPQFMQLGYAEGHPNVFDMTRLALHFAGDCNAVSQVHRRVSQKLLADAFPGHLTREVPIAAITNGVHLSTWADPAIARTLGASGGKLDGHHYLEHAGQVESTKLWELRTRGRQRLVKRLRELVEKQAIARRCSPSRIAAMVAGLQEDALYIGFARRFAPYKRAHLLLRDLDRLKRLLHQSERPVRILYAGLAHPNDGEGRDLLRRLVQLSQDTEFAGRIFFLAGYGLDLARDMIRGVDLWLNTPIRGLEASGTSGMKVAANGGINLSIEDGWWGEAYDGSNGWTIAATPDASEGDFQAELDAASIYRLLEDQIVPEFFDRNEYGVPVGWVDRMRRTLKTIPPRFNSHRMVREYDERFYQAASHRAHELCKNDFDQLRRRNEQHHQIRSQLSQLQLENAKIETPQDDVHVSDELQIYVEVLHDGFQASDIDVQLLLGPWKDDQIDPIDAITLRFDRHLDEHRMAFCGTIHMQRPGSLGYLFRVRPRQIDRLDDVLLTHARWQ